MSRIEVGKQPVRAIVAMTVLGLVALAAAPVFADIDVEVNDKVDFTRFSTYRWIEGAAADKPEVQASITKSIDDQLQARGLRRVDSGPADLDVSTFVFATFDADLWSATVTTAYGGRVGAARIRDVTEGTLVVKIGEPGADPDTAVWRGTATETLETTSTAEQIEKKVYTAVKKLFAKFPLPKK